MNEFAIKTDHLSRVYRTYQKKEGLWESLRGFWAREYQEKTALAATNLQIEPGKIIGLVGANGAGKTTLLKLLSGLIHPSSGTASVLGFEPWKREPAFLKKMSILLGQKNQLWWDLSPIDSFKLLADIYDLHSNTALSRVHELAEMLDCRHVLTTQLRRLSLGERMKMEIIGALLHSPDIMFLDEPTIGLDIVAQTKIRQFMSDYVKEKGPTIILTSHYMDDIAQLSDKLLLISKGNIVYNGDVKHFTQSNEISQKIGFSLLNSLERDLSLPNGVILNQGEQVFEVEVTPSMLAATISQISTLPGIHNLKIEEANFEDIIHRFLEKESRILSPRHSL